MIEYPGDGSQVNWELNFAGDFISRAHVEAYTVAPDGVTTPIAFTWNTDSNVTVAPAVAAGRTLRFQRSTPIDNPLVVFGETALLTSKNLNLANKQAIMGIAEVRDKLAEVGAFPNETAAIRASVTEIAVRVTALENGVVAPPTEPETGPLIFRVVPVSAVEAFVVAPHATLGAIALHMLKGNGTATSTPDDSVGGVFGGWRIQGFRSLPAVASNPATEYTEILSNGTGSHEIAIRRITGGGWAGHYHGFGIGAVYTQTAPDLTKAGYIDSVEFASTGRAKWTDGAYYDFTHKVRLNSDGSISTATNVIMPFDPNIVYLDMAIVSPTFTRASLDGGVSETDLTTLPTSFGTMAADVASVIMRNPGTGTTITIADDALDGTPGRNKIIMRRAGDFKVYPDLNPTPNPTNLNDVTVDRKMSFGRASVDPTVTLSNDIVRAEGNSGTNAVVFTVTRSTTVGAVSIPWTFSPGTTSADDYVGWAYPSGGSVALANGAASGTFTINVAGDTAVEGNETFSVAISAPVGYAAGAKMSGVVTITDDDAAFVPYSWVGTADGEALGTKYTLPFGTQNYSFDNSSKKIILTRAGSATGDTRILFGPFYPETPGAAFNVATVFEVAGSSPAAGTSSAWTRLTDGSGGTTGPNAAGGTVNVPIPAGENGPVYVLWRQPQSEGSDNVLRIVSAKQTTAVAPTVTLTADVSLSEGNTGSTAFVFTVTRSATSGAVSIPWTFSAGSTSPDDFAGGAYPSGGSVALAEGVASGTFTINVAGDAVIESNESFGVAISAPSGYDAGTKMTAAGGINNDDTVSLYLWDGVANGDTFATTTWNPGRRTWDNTNKRYVYSRAYQGDGGAHRTLPPPLSMTGLTPGTTYNLFFGGSVSVPGTSAGVSLGVSTLTNGGSQTSVLAGLTEAIATGAAPYVFVATADTMHLIINQGYTAASDQYFYLTRVNHPVPA